MSLWVLDCQLEENKTSKFELWDIGVSVFNNPCIKLLHTLSLAI